MQNYQLWDSSETVEALDLQITYDNKSIYLFWHLTNGIEL